MIVDEFSSPRPIAGRRIVATCFLLAIYAWGHGFYGLSVYVQFLGASGPWSTTLLSAATTFYFVLGAAAILVVERLSKRVPWRVLSGGAVLLMFASTSALAHAPNAPLLFLAYAGMAFAWAGCSGTAISQIVGDWFERRRGLALSIALTGASFGGIIVVPIFVYAIGELGVARGLASTSLVLSAAMLVLIGFNLVEPSNAHRVAAQAGRPAPPSARSSGPTLLQLGQVCGLFAVGWIAQVAFLSLQIPILSPRIGQLDAAASVAVTTTAAIAGRLLLGAVVDRVDHRAATAASFALQAAGMLVLLVAETRIPVFVGCALVGLSVGNVITLPAVFAQREFSARHYGLVISRVWSIGQLVFAFGPLCAGLMLAATGSAQPVIAACAACQLAAALLCVRWGRSGIVEA